MKLWAVSDLHLGHEPNRAALAQVTPRPEDWLIVAGDTGERVEHLELALETLTPRFRRLIWVPGNHDLWTMPDDPTGRRGEDRYFELVDVCRRYGALTPEDPYPEWEGEGPQCRIAPLFLLYDYSFRPEDVPEESAVAWAMASGILCADERHLGHEPYPSRGSWCRARCAATQTRLEEAATNLPLVLVNHFPLRGELAWVPKYPRFRLWCGTRRTEDWHVRYRALVVVSGHLHMRATRWRDRVRFEEVSLGYPRQWDSSRGIDDYIRQILPVPDEFPFAREAIPQSA